MLVSVEPMLHFQVEMITVAKTWVPSGIFKSKCNPHAFLEHVTHLKISTCLVDDSLA